MSINICENPLIKIKDIITTLLINYNNNSLIGGVNTIVKFDKTAICNGKIYTDPSNTLDDADGVQWIVGGVVQGNCREFFVKLVENRKNDTLFNIFKQHVIKGSIIISDGYPYYPLAVRNFGSLHRVVNHSIGFVNEFGDHTNQIENIWSHLKQKYRSKYEVKKKNAFVFE